MPNFNSREVARRIIESNVGRTFSEGDDPIGLAAAILDSALLAAHQEAGELADSVYRECFDGDFEGISYDEEKAISLLSAALESAKREEREKSKSFAERIIGMCTYEGQVIKGHGIPAIVACAKSWLYSLAEKEGGR